MQKMDRILNLTTPSDTEILVESFVNAPRELVYKAHVDPKAISHWFGPANRETKVIQMDVEIDGIWKFIQSDQKGNELTMHGKFLEIIPNKKISRTFNFGLTTDFEFIEILEFSDYEENKTKISMLTRYKSKDMRDSILQKGMKAGRAMSLERLESFITKSLIHLE